MALCQTTLLFPFVNSNAGFDTGIAIANTTQDPFGTKTQSGTCTLNFFGSGAGTTTTARSRRRSGRQHCAPRHVWAAQISRCQQHPPNGFTGYIIAVCNFQLAHGYALFSDTGIRNWATGYLALVIPTGTTDATRNRSVPANGASKELTLNVVQVFFIRGELRLPSFFWYTVVSPRPIPVQLCSF